MNEKKNFIINFISQIMVLIVNICINFFVTPYIIEKLGASSYGFVGLANEFIGYAQIITIALNSMASRFIILKFHEKDYEGANKFFNSVFFANILICCIIGFAGIFVVLFIDKLVSVPKEILFDVQLLWTLMFLNFLVSIITSVFGVATFAKNKLYLSSARQIESQILRSLLLLVCFYFLPPATWYIGLAILASTMLVSLYNYKYIKKLTPEIKINIKYFDKKSLLEVLASGIWNTITKLSSLLSSGLDLLITNKFVGSTAMGILSLSKTLPNALLSAFGSLSSVFAPELTYSYAKKKYDDIKSQLVFSIKVLGFLTSIPMAILFAYGIEFYHLWTPSQDAILLYTLTVITCFSFVLTMPLEPLWNVFTVANKVKQSSIFLITFSFITIAIVMLIIPFVTDVNTKLYVIAGVSTIFAVLRSLTFLPLYGAKCLNLKPWSFYPIIFKTTCSTAILTVISLGIKKVFVINSWFMLIVASLITSIFAIIINIIIIFNKKDRKDLIEMLCSIFRRRKNDEQNS